MIAGSPFSALSCCRRPPEVMTAVVAFLRRASSYIASVSLVLPEYDMRMASVPRSTHSGRVTSLTTEAIALEVRSMWSHSTSPPMAEPPSPQRHSFSVPWSILTSLESDRSS